MDTHTFKETWKNEDRQWKVSPGSATQCFPYDGINTVLIEVASGYLFGH